MIKEKKGVVRSIDVARTEFPVKRRQLETMGLLAAGSKGFISLGTEGLIHLHRGGHFAKVKNPSTHVTFS